MNAAARVLLVSTATRSYGTARIPRALAKAGFEVTLLTPRNALAETSRFVTRVAYFADRTTPLDWIHAVAATVRGVSCADHAVRRHVVSAARNACRLPAAANAACAAGRAGRTGARIARRSALLPCERRQEAASGGRCARGRLPFPHRASSTARTPRSTSRRCTAIPLS